MDYPYGVQYQKCSQLLDSTPSWWANYTSRQPNAKRLHRHLLLNIIGIPGHANATLDRLWCLQFGKMLQKVARPKEPDGRRDSHTVNAQEPIIRTTPSLDLPRKASRDYQFALIAFACLQKLLRAPIRHETMDFKLIRPIVIPKRGNCYCNNTRTSYVACWHGLSRPMCTSHGYMMKLWPRYSVPS
jgi:hypothetical protein